MDISLGSNSASPDPTTGQHDRISAQEAAAIVGLTYPGQFNNTRSRLELVRDRNTGGTRSYPPSADFEHMAGQAGVTRRRAEATWRKSQVLVVPEWGGVSLTGGDWSYSRRACCRWVEGLAGE